MANILRNTLGEKLLTKPINQYDNLLPSPNALKGKVLIKFKKLEENVGPCDNLALITDEDYGEYTVNVLSHLKCNCGKYEYKKILKGVH